MSFTWGPATGVGSMPGGDAREAAKTVDRVLRGLPVPARTARPRVPART